MKKNHIKTILTLMLTSLATLTAIADVKAYLNKSSFFEGDPITLKIETSTNNNAEPNLTPLLQDFAILGTRTNSLVNIMNGNRSFKKSWNIELQPNKRGLLTIPEITIGNEKTHALKLTITKLPPEVAAETNKHIFIESSIGITGNTIFVQQQIPYTIKLYYDAAMQTAQIQTPELENAIIEKLGADKRYNETRSGKRFTVIEKNFVISPEKSGTLRIPPAIASGRIALSGGDSQSLRKRMDETDMLNNFFNDFRNDPFFSNDPFGQLFSSRSRGPSKPFSLNSQNIKVDVLPVPDAFTGSAWLPAEDLIIKDSWAIKPPNLKVGEPVTRSLTLQVKGLAGSQIPDISFSKPEHVKSYPDKAISKTRTDGKTVYGIQQTEISYIPNKAGKVTIPKISIDWWDVKNQKQRTFVLPEWNLNVAPDLNYSANEEANNNNTSEEAPETSNNSPTEAQNENSKSSSNQTPDKMANWKLFITLTVLLLLFAFFVFKLKSKFTKQQLNSPKSQAKNISTLRSELLQACNNNDKKLAASKIIEYIQANWDDGSINSLGKLASKITQGSEIIRALDKSLYSEDSKEWNGKALAQLLESGLQQKYKDNHKSDSELAPLYPA